MSVRKVPGKLGWAVGFAVATIKPTHAGSDLAHLDRRREDPRHRGLHRGPQPHLAPRPAADGATSSTTTAGIPRYLAKSALFRTRFVGTVLRSAEQIPVERLTKDAIGAYDAAVTAVNDGECLVVYPEGTLTRDPDLWPMTGKSGAARIALATGAPVIPVGHWGVQDILYPYASRPHLFPRKHVTMKAGRPGAARRPARAAGHTPKVVNETTDRIMSALTDIVADLRGEEPPAERFDPRKAGIEQIGNPNKKKDDRP